MTGSRVLFRGPMLTIVKGSDVDEILIPDCIPKSGDTHPDGDVKVKHVAGMLIAEPAPNGHGQVEVSRVSLLDPSGKRLRVEFDAASEGACSADDSLKDSVALNALTDNGKSGPTKLRPSPAQGKKDPVAASIRLGSGVLAIDPAFNSVDVYDLPADDASEPIPSHELPLLKVWFPDDGPVRITVRNAKNDIVYQRMLDNEQSAFIYNWDNREPLNPNEFLEFPRKVCDGSNAVDRDFKWLYQLLIAPGDDWNKWRHGQPLPSPIAHCTTVSRVLKDLRTPGGSDCIDAVWWE